jgi:hypothetical protein
MTLSERYDEESRVFDRLADVYARVRLEMVAAFLEEMEAQRLAGISRGDGGPALGQRRGEPMTRIAITGGPRTGKTTLARTFAAPLHVSCDSAFDDESCSCGALRHTDDLIEQMKHLGKDAWSAASAEVANWLDAPGPWIIEGVAVSRALRKWRDAHPGEPPPVDRVIMLTEPFETLSKGQAAMAKGVATVHEEIEEWLLEHGVRTEYMVHRELSCASPGYNGMAKL